MKQEKALSRQHAITMVLAVLKDGGRHGYEIAREVEMRSSNLLSCRDGILYPILHALEKEGLIESAWVGAKGTRRKRVYTLTGKGLAELERSVQAWEEYASAMNRVLGGNKAFSAFLLSF